MFVILQCKMRFGGPEFRRQVEVLSVMFIAFYVPTLTSRLNSTETSLRLSENITLFEVCRIYIYIYRCHKQRPRYYLYIYI
jgi:hypothetical protein